MLRLRALNNVGFVGRTGGLGGVICCLEWGFSGCDGALVLLFWVLFLVGVVVLLWVGLFWLGFLVGWWLCIPVWT